MNANNIESTPRLMPAIAVKGYATGLLMMAFFTMMWTGIAFGSLQNKPVAFMLIVFPALAVLFIINGIRLFMVSKYYPTLNSEADVARGKRESMWFGIVFGAEGLGIFIAINLVTNLGHPDLVIPAIALVVGLHFYPMAKIFKRTVDYYLATWSTVIAICGFVFILNKTYPIDMVIAFVGIGLAIATSCHGLYMTMVGSKLRRPVAA